MTVRNPECIPRQLFNFIEPSCQFGSCHILGAFPVEDVRQFHGKLIGPLQLGIKLEDDVRSPSLCLCPFGLVLGEDVFGPCQQLFARVTVRIPERDVLYALAFPRSPSPLPSNVMRPAGRLWRHNTLSVRGNGRWLCVLWGIPCVQSTSWKKKGPMLFLSPEGVYEGKSSQSRQSRPLPSCHV